MIKLRDIEEIVLHLEPVQTGWIPLEKPKYIVEVKFKDDILNNMLYEFDNKEDQIKKYTELAYSIVEVI